MFFTQARVYLHHLHHAGNFSCWHAEAPRLRTFKEFVLGTEAVRGELLPRARSHRRVPREGVLAGPDVPFSQIGVGLLREFKIHLKAQRGSSGRTIANYMLVIQAVFS